jgi:hypothetical protein
MGILFGVANQPLLALTAIDTVLATLKRRRTAPEP